ncbi:MAG: FGGY family carbohydrate kinase, partial [bacterium]
MSTSELTLGIEFGSTRIKSTLIDTTWKPVASGSYTWQDTQVDGYWSYSLDAAWSGLREAMSTLVEDYRASTGTSPQIAAAGLSGMMHGYLVFDEDDNVLVPFRTWRNNRTHRASAELSELFQFPVPQRWSVAHLYEAILNGEDHVPRIRRLTSLAGHVHYTLTGRHVLGLNEASGMFPVDPETLTYDATYVAMFDEILKKHGMPYRFLDIMPEVVEHGTEAGTLNEQAVGRFDPTGTVKTGLPFCPPEGDAGTGMIATNSIRPRTANMS